MTRLAWPVGDRARCAGWLALAALLTLFVLPGMPRAQEITTVDDSEIHLTLSEAQFLRLPAPATALFLSNPGVAEIDLQTARYIYIIAKSVGETSLFVLGEDETPIVQTTISVSLDVDRMERAVRRAISGGDIAITAVEGAIFLNGQVGTPEDLQTAEDLLAGLAGPGAVVVNRLEVTQSAQVNLQVRIAEVSRTVSEDLGLRLGRSGATTITPPGSLTDGGYSVNVATGGGNINVLLDALAGTGLATILSEPNLTARSGETANFLAGGQLPYRVGETEDDTRIELQPYGVELEFTPEVSDRGRIEIRINTRVREIDSSAAASSSIGPALTERSASTTVDVGSGQSFAIAGMFQSTTDQALSGLPGLVNLPVIGALFRSSRYSRGETELVIIVTPYLVRPVDPAEVSTPLDHIDRVSGGLEQWGSGQLVRPGKETRSRVRINGGGGFKLQ
ncbi:type II and III secretion system protein family protein [Pseudooceanicola aestuarii]|uniref:type II and III secretion system protein family protein n=1 Tax=Pseudooceanicola aestuarii TaxID=2697319 RepID=UPI0013D4BDD1|nr:type II and III secretion system protein family protein [Pseudooceanicola aestuarii]